MNKFYDLGKVLEGQEVLRLLDEHLNRHIAIFGDIGSGKSRLLWQILREHRRNRRGFCLIDPGDLWCDFLADCAKEILRSGDRRLLKKIHLVQLNPFQMARYDPFHFDCPPHIHPELRESARICWQHTKIMSVAEVFQRKQNQMNFEGMPRLQRIMTDVLTFVSTLVDGRHLSIAHGQILLDLGHPLHDRVYHLVASSGNIPREVLADFEVLRAMRRVEDQRRENESTLNRWRSVFGPAMKSFMSGTGAEPTLDLSAIIQRGDYLIINVSKSPYASEDQNAGLAGLMIHDVAEAMLITPREKRRPFTLLIDEAHKYVAEDVGTLMRVARKYELGIVTSTPDLEGLRRKDVDLRPVILGIPKTKIAFCMTLDEDTEKMARVLYSGDFDFTERMQEREVDAGYEFLEMIETSESISGQANWSDTDTETDTESETDQEGTGNSVADTVSEQETIGGVKTESKPKHGQIRPAQVSEAKSGTRANGKATSATASTTKSHGRTTGKAKGKASAKGGSLGRTFSKSTKTVPLHRVKTKIERTGQLERSINDQVEEKRQLISNRSDRQAVVKYPGSKKAVEIQTLEVSDPFLTAEDTVKMVEWLQRELIDVHDYFHTPNLDPVEQDRALEEQLNRYDDGDVPLFVDRPNGLDEENFPENPLDG